MEQNHMLPRPANHATAGLDQKHDPFQHDRRQTPSSDLAAIFHPFDRPLKLPLYPAPPSYSQAAHPDRKSPLVFPDAPKTELAPIKSAKGKQNERKEIHTLPSLSSLTVSSPKSLYASPSPEVRTVIPPAPTYAPPPPPPPAATAQAQPTRWPSLNPLTAYYTPSHAEGSEAPLRMDEDSSSNGAASAASPEQLDLGRSSSVSLDDPDVRLAAEALGDLRADFVSSPQNRDTPGFSTPRSQSQAPPEPLLQLLTTNHPLIGNVIEGTQSAYVASKNYSPRFKTGAEYVEGYVTPIANTVGSVGRVTGVEGGVRWFLGGGKRHKSRSSSDMESGSNKRRRADDGSDIVMGEADDEPMSGAETPRPTYDPNDRRLSIASTIDTLPAYDEHRSPAYELTETRANSNAPWQSRLIMSTSGLSIAMGEQSLRSLKYCLSWLRWANVHIGNVINSLKQALDRLENRGTQPGSSSADADDRQKTIAKIMALKADVLRTLQEVISTVSRYAGGALPENARALVRRHLTSLPQRFRLAAMAGESQQPRDDQTMEEAMEAKDKEMREGATRVLLLAKEGLDMMAQVSGVLEGTIMSAEEWCERLGKRKHAEKDTLLDVRPVLPQYHLEDVKMG